MSNSTMDANNNNNNNKKRKLIDITSSQSDCEYHLLLLVVTEEHPELFMLTGTRDWCTKIQCALQKSHDKRKKKEVSTFDHASIVNFLIASDWEDYIDIFEHRIGDESSHDDDDTPAPQKTTFVHHAPKINLARYFGDEVIHIKQIKENVKMEFLEDGCVSDFQNVIQLMTCYSFH